MPSVNRRTFLVSAAATSGALTLGFAIAPSRAGDQRAAKEINAWIVIEPDDSVIIRVARADMGQGVLTALPMLVAEELACDWAKVRAEYALPHESLRRRRAWGDMSTGGSRSVRASQLALRQAGATAREMLIAAAAAQWSVAPGECRAANGIVTHGPSGRTARFGELASAAAQRSAPSAVRLKEPAEWTLIGTRQKRLDAKPKVTGKTNYGIDVIVPGMLHAAIRHCPEFGCDVERVDAKTVESRPGVRGVVRLPGAVAVVADSWWQAQQAVQAVPITWKAGLDAATSNADIDALLREGLDADDADVLREDGDALAALEGSPRRVTADYVVPFLAHATMEPQNCTAHVTPGKVEIWAPTQNAEAALSVAAAAAGVSPEKVVLHRTALGGGFGRRGAMHDFVREAVLIASEIGRPVKLTWSREEDFQHDFYRPIAMARLTAGLAADGRPEALSVRISGQSLLASILPGGMVPGGDRNFAEGFLEDMPYAVGDCLVDYAMRNTHVPVGFWRSVNYSQNVFFRESFVDEMAHATGSDPCAYRRILLAADEPRWRKVLDTAALAADWGAPLPAGIGRGIAINGSFDSVCAQVVEASVKKGVVRVHRVVVALDCGHVVNPFSVEAQVESAVAEGLSAALHGGVEIAQGAVVQSNFHDYPLLRMSEMPKVETHLLPSDGWGGVGETPVPPLAPALCNALFAATGERVRSLPLAKHRFRPL